MAASSAAPTMPVTPRMVSTGNSPTRYLVTGQLKPQPTEVMARNIRPAGARRAGAVDGGGLVIGGTGENWGHPLPPNGRRHHRAAGMPAPPPPLPFPMLARAIP